MFRGPWKLKKGAGMEVSGALIKLNYAVSRKGEGVFSLFRAYESQAHLEASIHCDEFNGPIAPLLPNYSALRMAYWGLGLKHPELVADEADELPDDVRTAFGLIVVPEPAPQSIGQRVESVLSRMLRRD